MFEKLLSKYKSKENSFTEMYNESFNYIYSFVYSRVGGNRQVAEEIVQEAFAAAWVSYDNFSYRSAYNTWLIAIARNKLNDYYRKKTASEKIVVADDEMISDVPSELDLEKIVINNETSGIVISVLESLNPVYRYSLIMKYIDECNVKQIARVLGRTPKAVDGILQRAKNSFTKEYLKVMGKVNNNE